MIVIFWDSTIVHRSSLGGRLTSPGWRMDGLHRVNSRVDMFGNVVSWRSRDVLM